MVAKAQIKGQGDGHLYLIEMSIKASGYPDSSLPGPASFITKSILYSVKNVKVVFP